MPALMSLTALSQSKTSGGPNATARKAPSPRALALVTADAEALDCSDQVEYCRTIVSGGTSADAQLQIYTENIQDGAEIALHKVARWIKDATLAA